MREEKKIDKVMAIYKAIEELLAEGADLASMRVSDIAARAEIGKGTTYEYFSSKEEMIVKAMIFLVDSMVKRILNQMEHLPSFQESFIMLLDEMEEKVKQRACIMKYLSLLSDMNFCQHLHNTMQQNQESKESNPLNIIRYLIKKGQTEGVLGIGYSQSYMETVMFSRLISFMMFVNGDLGEKDCTSEEMKLALYNGICRELCV